MKKISVTVLFGFFCLSTLASVKTSTFKDKSFSLNGPQYILNQSDSLALECIRLGMNFSTLGLYEEANEQLWAAIDIYSEQNNMTGVLWCQEAIANNLAYLGKSEETIALGEKNLAICEKIYGKNSVRYFNALNNMAAFYGYAGDLRR